MKDNIKRLITYQNKKKTIIGVKSIGKRFDSYIVNLNLKDSGDDEISVHLIKRVQNLTTLLF